MLFNSIGFLVFFPIVTLLYFLLPFKFRWFHLLAASCIFYMAFIPIYILILFFTIIVDYFAGIYIEKSSGSKRKLYLIISIIANVSVLAVFKYYNFFIDNFNGLFHVLHLTSASLPLLKIILPVGLSFHTFQAMSYTIEVYRGVQKAEYHFGIYALYVMFYPQLLAGPIERPQNLLHQFRENHTFDYDRVTSGLRLMLWGFFKKIVIADRFGALVDKVYSNPHHYNGVTLTLAAIFFVYEIYCDFSGYTDIARGAARIMGFKLMKNFDRPFSGRSISEYWSRWHISLTTWFRDYVFYPLSISLSKSKGNRTLKLYAALFTVYFISGLWHGANWTFVLFGGLHGCYVVFAVITKKSREKLENFIGLSKLPALSAFFDRIIVFALVAFALIFFRASNVHDAYYIATHIFSGWTNMANLKNIQMVGDVKYSLLPWFGMIFILELMNYITGKYDITKLFMKQPVYIRWGEYFTVIVIICYCAIAIVPRQFIYFQF